MCYFSICQQEVTKLVCLNKNNGDTMFRRVYRHQAALLETQGNI